VVKKRGIRKRRKKEKGWLKRKVRERHTVVVKKNGKAETRERESTK